MAFKALTLWSLLADRPFLRVCVLLPQSLALVLGRGGRDREGSRSYQGLKKKIQFKSCPCNPPWCGLLFGSVWASLGTFLFGCSHVRACWDLCPLLYPEAARRSLSWLGSSLELLRSAEKALCIYLLHERQQKKTRPSGDVNTDFSRNCMVNFILPLVFRTESPDSWLIEHMV